MYYKVMILLMTRLFSINAKQNEIYRFHVCMIVDTTLCDKCCRSLAAAQWFSPGTSVSSTNKSGGHNKTEILLKVALNTITP